MIHIRQGSIAYEMLTFLSYVAEFPYASIALLGNYETYRKTITKMAQDQTYRIPDHPQKITGRLLNISGSKKQKTIRLGQKGVEVLQLINPADQSRCRCLLWPCLWESQNIQFCRTDRSSAPFGRNGGPFPVGRDRDITLSVATIAANPF